MSMAPKNSIVNALRETPLLESTSILPTLRLTIPSSVDPDSETKFLKLPKPEQLAADPERYFNNHLSVNSGVVECSDFTTTFDSLSWSVINSSKSLVLAPSNLKSQKRNNINVPLNKIQIDFPEHIRKDCLIVRIELNDAKPVLVTDLITVNGILVTIFFELDDFKLHNISNSNFASADNWCFVSIPYDFDVREPHSMHSITALDFLIFLKDGGVAKCSRGNFKESPTVALFSDTSYVSSTFGRLGRFLPIGKGQDYDENENNYNIPKGYTLKTILDCFVINNEYLVTITLNRKLKVWSISLGLLIDEKKIALESEELTHKLLGDGTPTRLLSYLQTPHDNSHFFEKEFYFVNYLPIGNGQFKLWKFAINDQEGVELHDLGTQFQYTPIIPDSNSIWLVQDFHIVQKSFLQVDKLFYSEKEPWLNVLVLFKSNTSSVYQLLTIFKDGGFNWVKSKLSLQIFPEINPKNFPSANSQESSEYFLDKILNSNKYSHLVIETALAYFDKTFNQNIPYVDIPIDSPIKEKLTIIIGRSVDSSQTHNYSFDITKQWQSFESLCQEFSKLANESLSINYLASIDTVLICKVLDPSILRLSGAVESLFFNRQKLISDLPLLSTLGNFESERKSNFGITKDANILKFVNVLSNFKYSLSSSILVNLRTLFLQNIPGSVLDKSNFIFKECLAGKIPETGLQSLMNELNSIPDAFKIIGYFLQYPDEIIKEGNLILNTQYLNQIKTEEQNGMLGPIRIVQSLKQSLSIFEEIYFDILLITLILDFESNITSIILTKALAAYKRINLAYKTFSIAFSYPELTTPVGVEKPEVANILNTEDLGSPYNSLFYRLFAKHVGFSGNAFELNRFLFSFIVDDRFFYAALDELTASANHGLLLNKIIGSDTNLSSPIAELFKGVAYLNNGQPAKAVYIFSKNASDVVRYTPSGSEFPFIQSLLKFFNTLDLFEYYHETAVYFRDHSAYTDALSFAKQSIKEYDSSTTEEDEITRKKLHLTYFSIALELQNFDEAFSALMELSVDPESKDYDIAKEIRHEALKGFVSNIIRSTDLKSFITYSFPPSDLVEIDDILYETANGISFNFKSSSSLNFVNKSLSSALKYFKILYSWRLNHGNVKGACEALYHYINKYHHLAAHPKRGKSVIDITRDAKFERVRAKQDDAVKEVFRIIVNLLGTVLEEDDRWIRRECLGKGKSDGRGYELLRYDELKAESAEL